MKIKIIGIDAAFANLGIAYAEVDLDTFIITVTSLELHQTEAQNKKVVRKSSDDLRRARELRQAINNAINISNASLAIAEVPHGSQSARASWSLGIVVGVLASCPVALIEVSAMEVKLASVGKKNASKQEMIKWAMKKFPKLNWKLNKGRPTLNNEHLADAVATIFAGIKAMQFKEMILLSGLRVKTKRRRLL